ncbi:MAG: ABC transporter permease [Treponema sp.]|nr:MAG: ABC transporter permease [Treponema sp.]
MEKLNNNLDKKANIKDFLIDNIVTILFSVICVLAIIASKEQPFMLISAVTERLTRNSFLVLALLIPVVAGMGLNFSITIGAMAAQVAIIIVAYFKIPTFLGLATVFVIATPLAILLGWLIGRMLNKTIGQEMIASMITGFFADGIYQLIFLFLVGTVIPVSGALVISGGVGLRNTINLNVKNDAGEIVGIGKSLDHIIQWPLFTMLLVISLLAIGFYVYQLIKKKGNQKKNIFNLAILIALCVFSAVVVFSGKSMPRSILMLKRVKISVFTALIVAAFAVFNIIFLKTKLGQTFRAVGHNMHIAEVSGINIKRVRVLAIILSTMFAAWGHIIFLQNFGTLNTYGSHKQVALFAVAALLIGGASVSRATVGQAFLGVLLFHTLFIVSPKAGLNLFGDPQLGEFFRTTVAYGVIGVSLGLFAWKQIVMNKNKKDK